MYVYIYIYMFDIIDKFTQNYNGIRDLKLQYGNTRNKI